MVSSALRPINLGTIMPRANNDGDYVWQIKNGDSYASFSCRPGVDPIGVLSLLNAGYATLEDTEIMIQGKHGEDIFIADVFDSYSDGEEQPGRWELHPEDYWKRIEGE